MTDTPKRYKVLVLAYMVSPHRGSEYSVGWNYATHMSKLHDLTILYGAAGDHMGDVDELQRHLADHPVPGARFVDVLPGPMARLLNSLNRRGILPFTFYFAYAAWHRKVYRVARRLVQEEHYDLVHYLNPIGFREPGWLWKLDLPYLWGPIGGANKVSPYMMEALSVSGKLKYGFRELANYIQLHWNPRLRRALQHTDQLAVTTTEIRKVFRRIYKKESYYVPENGILALKKLNRPKFHNARQPRFIWIGRIDDGKALNIFLKALTLVKASVGVDIVGDGPLRPRMEAYANRLGLTNLVWHGQLERSKVMELMNWASLNVITSVSEGNPTTIWEAMSMGVPTIAPNHCGMADVLCPYCGIKINLAPMNEFIPDFASQLDRIARRTQDRLDLGETTTECARQHDWETRTEDFEILYSQTIAIWKRKQLR